MWEPFSFGQPFADAGGTYGAGDESDWDSEVPGEAVSERGEEAASVPTRAGLRVVGEPPIGPDESGDETGAGLLFFFAVVGGIGLPGDHEYLTDADVFA